MKLLREHPVLVAVAILIAASLAWGFRPQPVLVDAASVRRAALSVTVDEEGRTRVIDRYTVAAPVDGVACDIDLKVGEAVEKGQVLLVMTPPESQVLDPRSRAEAEARVAASRAAVAAARQQVQSARAESVYQNSEVKRLRALGRRGVVSQEALDRAEMEVMRADAGLRSANHAVEVALYELEAAETSLGYSAATHRGEPAESVAVRAPISGQILKVPSECEGPVRTGEPLLEVGDPGKLEVEVDVLSADAVRINPGTPVLFERWGGDEPLEGVVRTVEPVGFTKISALGVEEQRVLVIVDFTSPYERWQRLGDGYRVEARFVLWHEEDVLQVPAGALFRRDEAWATFVVRDGEARLQPVRLGKRNGLSAQVLEGLREGEQVIVHPSDAVFDGARVKVR